MAASTLLKDLGQQLVIVDFGGDGGVEVVELLVFDVGLAQLELLK